MAYIENGKKVIVANRGVSTNPGFIRACDNVLEHGDKTGCEKVVLLNANGDALFEIAGDETHVSLNSEAAQRCIRILSKQLGSLAVHNHPGDGGSSLSGDDITMSGYWNIETWAATDDGGRYGTRGPLRDRLNFHQSQEFEERCSSLRNTLFTYKERGQLTYPELAKALSHLENVVGWRMGILDYAYVVGNKSKDAINKFMALYNTDRKLRGQEAIRGDFWA